MQNLKPHQWTWYSIAFIGLPCILNGSIAKAWLFKAMIGYLENCGVLSYTDLQNGDTFHFMVLKKSQYYHQSHQKSFKFSEAIRLIVADTHFPEIWFLEVLNFNIDNKFYHLFSSKWQLTFIIFKKISARYRNLNNRRSLGILSSKNDVLWKWFVQLATQTIPQMFFLENNYTPVCSKSAYAYLSYRMLK